MRYAVEAAAALMTGVAFLILVVNVMERDFTGAAIAALCVGFCVLPLDRWIDAALTAIITRIWPEEDDE